MEIDRPEHNLGLTPAQIVEELDRYIVGQNQAKRLVALALRSQARRQQVEEGLRNEITPKNIIMIGPTGCGKTEIARRLARLVKAPFIKVEATKYTEVGYVGRDVESMIRDLTETAIKMVRDEWTDGVLPAARSRVEERLLDLLLPPPPGVNRQIAALPDGSEDVTFIEASSSAYASESEEEQQRRQDSAKRYIRTREKFKKMLKTGQLEDRQVEFSVSQPSAMISAIPMGPNMPGMDEMGMNFSEMLQNMLPTQQKEVKMSVGDAREVLLDEEIEKLLDMDKITREAVRRVEEQGIIFIDELDKIAAREGKGGSGPDVSREGVQRDILPIIEGSTVFTKHGMIRTDHVLFIAAGAFHMSKPSDLIPELQGRFPLRVELHSLTEEDFKRILTEPENSLVKQYQAMLGTEDVDLEIGESAIDALAKAASRVNAETENIGARRLHTLLEKVLEEISFNAPTLKGQRQTIDGGYVNDKLKDIIKDQNLSQFVL
ncbi:ATP-dependent protease ATPase subunit HslU [Candidatus Sumerlaeota bacterium]|nr:ATP-dependent protease ATPase subunit HslU [Candidatus Sumerlaeota bacterium]